MLKVYRGELSWKRDKEVFLLELVAGRVPVPEIVYTTQGILVMTRLPGRPARFTDDDPVEVSRQLGGLLRELHTITFDSFGYIETRVTSPVPTNLEYMRRRVDRKVRSGPPDLRDSLERYFAEREAAFEGCETAVLCHNDAHDANVLVEDGRITGLIDWENAVAADPIFDLAKAWAFSDGRSDETLAALVDGYGPLRDDWREAFELVRRRPPARALDLVRPARRDRSAARAGDATSRGASMPEFLPGRELSRAFYEEVVARDSSATCRTPPRSLGYGSDVLGYDTERSTDHGWGPRLQIFTEAELDLDAQLPETFRGWPVRYGWDDQRCGIASRSRRLGAWLDGAPRLRSARRHRDPRLADDAATAPARDHRRRRSSTTGSASSSRFAPSSSGTRATSGSGCSPPNGGASTRRSRSSGALPRSATSSARACSPRGSRAT